MYFCKTQECSVLMWDYCRQVMHVCLEISKVILLYVVLHNDNVICSFLGVLATVAQRQTCIPIDAFF